MRISCCKSLKTKDLSPKTEVFCLVGGGETHSELSTPTNCSFSSHIKVCYYLANQQDSVVDSRSVEFIRMLQKHKVSILALTAAPAKVKGSECPGNWRVDELRRFGFDFQNTFPQDNCIMLPKSEQYPQSPMFKLGVLYSSFHPKGDILITFLQHLNLNPEKIIFVDDELKHVQSVISCLDKAGIQCVGIHYTAANEMPCDLNLELARFQVNFFVENDVWLSDKEGLDILSNHPEHCQIK